MTIKEHLASKGESRCQTELDNHLKILNLFSLDIAERNKLKKEIRKQNGSIDILVHPYWGEDSVIPNLADQYSRNRHEFIKSALHNKKPLIIFETEDAFDERSRQLTELFSNGKLYMVPTDDISNPVTQRGLRALQQDWEAGWKLTKVTLRNIGVENIRIGGKELKIARRSWSEWPNRRFSTTEKQPKVRQMLKGNKIPGCCVGSAAIHLAKKGFDISFLPVTAPQVWENN